MRRGNSSFVNRQSSIVNLFAVYVLAVLLPCAVLGLIGYKWLGLERDAALRRGKEAAEAEAARLRHDLVDHVSATLAEAAGRVERRPAAAPPFAPTPELPEPIATACLFRRDGRLLYPDYESNYRRTIDNLGGDPRSVKALARAEELEARGQTEAARRALQNLLDKDLLGKDMPGQVRTPGRQAALLLRLGRLSLAEKRWKETEAFSTRILNCCAGERDEYGVPFALYAARQMTAAWERQGTLRGRFPELAARLGDLLKAGWIGHPRDLPHITELSRKGGGPSADTLIGLAEREARRIAAATEIGKRLEKWIAASSPSFPSLPSGGARRVVLGALWKDDQPLLVGLSSTESGSRLAATLVTERVAAWIAARASSGGRFEAGLSRVRDQIAGATLQAPLLSEAPAFDLVLRAAESDPVTERRRQWLFAGALAAAMLLVLMVGFFALRDVSRELKLAGMRSNFVAGVTHEMKTPLTSIRMLAETVRLGRMRDPAVADHLLGTLVDETERLGRLLDNVLTFARIEKGARLYQPREIELEDAVRGAVRSFEYFLQQEGFRLEIETSGAPVRVCADGEALGRAVLNLLSNAAKYSGASREIRLAIHADATEAEIRVADRGIGVPRSEQRRIFESFYRAPEAARETAGAGLGLALVKHFVEAHGGRITVSSEPGKGSEFSLWLPRLQPENGHGQDIHRRG